MRPKRQNKQKDILFVLISSFILVVFWIGFNLYHIWVTSTVSEDIQMQLTPIDPTFDQKTINLLKKRETINPLYNLQSASQSASTNEPTPSPEPSTVPSDTSQLGVPTDTPVPNTSQTTQTPVDTPTP